MRRSEHLWVIVLAAGEGTRLQALTMDGLGAAIPKQFFSFDGRQSMLRWTLDRAGRLAPPERTVVVVAEQHWHWWEADLCGHPRENIVVQPKNRGTAAGILLPLFHVIGLDGLAHVAVLPSDHHVESEDILGDAIAQAAMASCDGDDRVVLLGMNPDASDDGYGLIVPSRKAEGPVRKVAAFVEKPDAVTATLLKDQGALWNSNVFVAARSALLRLYEHAAPGLLHSFLEAVPMGKPCPAPTARAVYQRLGSWDFSRDVLERATELLWVLPVKDCGWSDLGTPERAMRVWSAISCREPAGARPFGLRRSWPGGVEDTETAGANGMRRGT